MWECGWSETLVDIYTQLKKQRLEYWARQEVVSPALLYVTESVKQLGKREKKLLDIEKISYMYYNGAVTKNAHNV